MKAALYIRVSTSMQAESGLGLEVQEERGLALAASRGWEVVEVFREEGASARAGKSRPVLEEAIARADEYDVLIFHKLDRLGRSARDLLNLYDELEGRGVALVSLQGGVDTSSPAGRLLRTVLAAAAEFEADLISERTTAATGARVRRGQHHGRPPYGYTSVEGSLLKVEAEAVIVQRIFESFAAGQTQRDIARSLTADGVQTRDGKPWTQSFISKLLRNPAYLGKVHINGAEFQGQHDPIISCELWERAHAQLSSRTRKSGRPSAGRHLFTRGLLRCAHCGYGMGVRVELSGTESYICLGRHEHGGSFCPQTPVPREAVDVAAFAYFQQIGLDVEQAQTDLEAQLNARKREAKLLRDDQQLAVAKLRGVLDRWDSMLADGELEPEEWRRLVAKTREELEPAEARVAILTDRLEELEASDIPQQARDEVLQQLAELRAAVAGEVTSAEGLGQVRAQLRRLFDHFDVGRTDVEADPDMPIEMREAREQALAEARTSEWASADGTWLIIPWPRAETVEPLEYEWAPPLKSTPGGSSGHTSLPWPPFVGRRP